MANAGSQSGRYGTPEANERFRFMRVNLPILSLTALLLGLGACSTRSDTASANGNADRQMQTAGMPVPPSPVTPDAPADAVTAGDLTVTSIPAAGSTVEGPVYKLVLNFSQPAALGEVLVEGPSGLMPMMVASAGEQTRFELPLSGLDPGKYKISWKAVAAGAAKSGTFTFTVR